METETSTTYRLVTGAGTVHTFTAGRTYSVRGDKVTNTAASVIGKADCGATTSSAARHTDAAVNCAKCLAVAK